MHHCVGLGEYLKQKLSCNAWWWGATIATTTVCVNSNQQNHWCQRLSNMETVGEEEKATVTVLHFFKSTALCNLEKCGCCERTLWQLCQAGYLWNLQRFQMGENSVPGAILDYNHKPAAVTEAGKPLPTAVGANIISNAGSTLRCAVNSPLHCRNTKKSTLHCRNTKRE